MGLITADDGFITADNAYVTADGRGRVRAVKNGCYNGTYYQEGDVFDINQQEYSDSTVNYAGPHAGVQQYGWMIWVVATTPLLQAQSIQSPAPMFPVANLTPPEIYIY